MKEDNSFLEKCNGMSAGNRSTSNLVLIGMPGAGKSTTGILLAKLTSRGFTDTDVLIQSREGASLKDLLEQQGPDAFLRMEEWYLLDLFVRNHVIATGGSVVYSEPAMDCLRQTGVVIHLDWPLESLVSRLGNLDYRGVVRRQGGQSLADLYAERTPLYEKYADVTIPCAGLNHEQVLARILKCLHDRGIPL